MNLLYHFRSISVMKLNLVIFINAKKIYNSIWNTWNIIEIKQLLSNLRVCILLNIVLRVRLP